MPQRAPLLTTQSPFGPSVFSTSWNSSRGRASTLSGQLQDPTSPPRLGFRKDSLIDTDIRTLDYLGLVDPSPQSATLDVTSLDALAAAGYDASLRPLLANTTFSNNRFRSYSVNAKEKYGVEDDEEALGTYYSGTLTPSAEAAAQALAATRAQIHQHNLEVQAFAHQASSSRPRAQTTGLLDSSSRFWRNYIVAPSRLDNTLTASDLEPEDANAFEVSTDALQALQMQQLQQNQMLQQYSTQPVAIDIPNSEEVSRALWLGNIPASATPASLKAIFETFGKVDSARVLTHKSCGFVNYEKIESAVLAKSQFDGKEVFSGGGPVRIGFAKPPSAPGGISAIEVMSSSGPGGSARTNADTNAGTLSTGVASLSVQADEGQSHLIALNTGDMHTSIIDIVRELGATPDEQSRISAAVERALAYDQYATEIPAVPEPSQSRMHDAPRLREIRKKVDNNLCSQLELEDIALTMLPEIVELSSDYLGNTVVQKLFEYCTEPVKEAMLQQIGPHLAEIGVHKNGTWAAQKIIDVAHTPVQMSTIVDGLRPYSIPCFLDQYGNYVMQCCLRFGAPFNNFIFETMFARLMDVAQGRFGARAMRASLESHHVSKDQQKMFAAAIALNVVQLATNTNGALLLTWYLDTCTLPNRRKVLASRLIEHLVDVCTHKVAHLTVLKIINQRNEPEARDMILRAIFFSPQEVLTELLKDQSCGANLIFKIITTPFFDDALRSEVGEKVRNVLLSLKAQPSQGYKRLMDEVQLTPRGQGGGARDLPHSGRDQAESSRPTSKHDAANASFGATQASGGQPNGSYFPKGATQPHIPYNPGGSFPQTMNQNVTPAGSYDQYNGLVAAQQASHMNFQQAQMTPQSQLQYQTPRPVGIYTPEMHAFAAQSTQMPQYYQTLHRNPMINTPQQFQMPPGAIMAQPGFNPQNGFAPMMGMGGNRAGNMWPQYPNSYMMPQQQQQQQQQMQGRAMMGDGRRGRVSGVALY